MTKYSKVNGKYLIKGKSYELLSGSRAQVYHGTAYKTSGNLKKTDLIQNKHGRIVSAAKFKSSKQKGKNNLFNKGYSAKKGHFGPIRHGVTLSHKNTHRRRHHRRIHGGTHTPENTTDTTTTPTGTTSNTPSTTGGTFQPSESRSLLADMSEQIGGKSRKKRHSRGRRHSRGGNKRLFLGGSNHKQLFLG